MPTKEARPVRGCDACGQVDDHPRHQIGMDYLPTAQQTPTSPEIASKMIDACGSDTTARTAILAHIQDNTTLMYHMDCCRDRGCPDRSCDVVTSGAETLKGDELVKHLTSPKAEKAAIAAGFGPNHGEDA